MAKVATFSDVEDWLPTVLDAAVSVPVASRAPDPLVASFVRVFRSGGPGRTNRVAEVATVVVESFAATEMAAQQIAQTCRTTIAELEDTTPAVGVHVKAVTEVSSPGNLPHPTIPGSRYTQTFDIGLKGTA